MLAGMQKDMYQIKSHREKLLVYRGTCFCPNKHIHLKPYAKYCMLKLLMCSCQMFPTLQQKNKNVFEYMKKTDKNIYCVFQPLVSKSCTKHLNQYTEAICQQSKTF